MQQINGGEIMRIYNYTQITTDELVEPLKQSRIRLK